MSEKGRCWKANKGFRLQSKMGIAVKIPDKKSSVCKTRIESDINVSPDVTDDQYWR